MSESTPPSIVKHWHSLALAILPGLLAVAAYLFFYIPLVNDQLATLRSGDLARAKAQMLDNNFQQLVHQLDGIARLSDVRQAMRDNDIESIDRMTNEFSLGFTHLDQLALLPLGELGIANLGTHKEKVRNNIEKDILRRAANDGNVLVDTYVLNGARVISLARPVFAGNRSIGAILLTLKAGWLSSQLETVSAATDIRRVGVTELVYQIGVSEPVLVVSDGSQLNDSLSSATQDAELVSNPNLRIRFTLTRAPVDLGFASIVLLAFLVVAIVFSMLAVIMVFRGISKSIREDAEKLENYVEDIFQREVSPPALSNSYLNGLMESFSAVATKAEVARNVPDQASKKDKDGEDSSAWANPQLGGSIEVEDIDDIPETPGDDASAPPSVELPAHIFRAYDIRGDAEGELSDELVHKLGLAIGSTAIHDQQDRLVVGRDGRLSSERIANSLVQGLLESGCDVIDIGLVTTPMLYFAAESLATKAGVMVTGSHNGPDQNGLKIVLGGHAIAEQQIAALAECIKQGDFASGKGLLTTQDIADAYIDQIAEDVVVASPMKVVLDCGNGAASEIAPMLYASLGCEVLPLFAEVDGTFPNRSPDPGSEGSLQALVGEVQSQNADLGLAFDGDADRVVAVTSSGQIVDADKILMLFARDVLTRNPGADVVYDIKCSRHLNQVIAGQGGRPVMWKSGHSLIKQKMLETGALLGGEFSGHFFFKERWFGFDDGIYSGARLIEFLTLEGMSLDSAVDELPTSCSSPEIYLPVADNNKFAVVDALQSSNDFGDGQVTILDGVRVDYPDGWGVVRASNTSPNLYLRFEATNEAELDAIKHTFAQALSNVDPALGQRL